MKFSLYREDGAGDCGPMFNIFRWVGEKIEWERQAEKPKLGWHVQVGSPYGRTYVAQDYWTTTPVTEIIEEREGYMEFKTRSGSTYIWKHI